MWISQKAWLQNREEFMELRAARDAVNATNQQQASTLSWLMIRMTQLEHERAQMLWKYMGIKVTVPTVEEETPSGVDNPFNRLPSFDDVGDEAALKEGIGWNDFGEVTYQK